MATNAQKVVETTDTGKLEFYRLIGEGYKAMQDGRTSTIDEVRERIEKIVLINTLDIASNSEMTIIIHTPVTNNLTFLPIISSPNLLIFGLFSLNVYLKTSAKSVEQSLYPVLNS